jgi:methyl-accepting chemotaxis protein
MIIVLISSSIGLIASKSSTKALQKTVNEDLVEHAKAYSTYIDSEILNAKTIMDGIANRNALKSWNWDEQYEAMKYEVARNKIFSDMFVVNKNGDAQCITGSEANVSNREYFKQAMKGNTYFSNLLYSESLKEFIFFVSAPIKGNNVEGTVVGCIKAEYLSNAIKDISLKNGRAFIINNEGTTIAHPDINRVLEQDNLIEMAKSDSKLKQFSEVINNMIKGEQGTDRYVYQGIKYYCGYYPIGDTGWSIAITALEDKIFEEVFHLRRNLCIMIMVAIILAIIINYYAGNKFVKPIILATNHATIMSKLDLTTNVPPKFLKREDEIGNLAKSFDIITDNLKIIIKEIQNSALELNNSSKDLTSSINENAISVEEISETIKVITIGATQQAEEADNTVRELSNLGDLITESQEIAEDVNISTNSVKEVNLQGKEIIEKLKNEFDLSLQVTQEMKNNTNDLEIQSKSINSILDTISKIASQTNLLALNASIEAARAGEAGKGFAVVAEEISKLAEDTEKSTGNISKILETMTNKIEITNCNMEKAEKIVENVNMYIEETVTSYDIIENKTKELIILFTRLNNALKEIDENKINAFSCIENISEVCHESASSTEEVNASVEEQAVIIEQIAKSSERLSEIASLMEKLVEKFKI